MRGLIKCGLLIVCLPLTAMAAPSGWQPLLEPAGLSEILLHEPDIRVIRVTGNYARGHIPGSLNSPYADWRGAGENPGELRSLAEYTSLLQELGISASSPVAVIHEGSDPADMGAATRVYWTLKTLGVESVAVVNGGFRAWEAAGLAVTSNVDPVPQSSYQPVWDPAWRITTEEVETLLASGEGVLIDARPGSFFRGFRATAGSPGTIHGARNLEYSSWFEGDRLPETSALAAKLEQFGKPEAPVTVSFCNTGHWAAINWFVLSELLGVDNTRLYAESIGAWSALELPMDNQPNRGQVYRELTSRWLQSLFGN